MINLEEKTLTELKDLAKENNIKNISKLKKEELIQVLEQVINTNTKNTETNTDSKETTQELSGYKLTNEGDEIVEGILDLSLIHI